MNEQDVVPFIKALGDGKNNTGPLVNFSDLGCTCITLPRLSLVLNVISDELVISIASSLPFIVELDLEDRPSTKTNLLHDLNNNGLRSLRLSRNLTSLSIVRSSLNIPAAFERVYDSCITALFPCLSGLDTLTLGGFSNVTNLGFEKILKSCKLKKFEVRHAPQLTDWVFHNIAIVSLTELRIISCSLITSIAIAKVAASETLEVLVINHCRNIANLSVKCITDSGLAILGIKDLPIAHLSLRGCEGVTDRGIFFLLNGGQKIKKTLLFLDISYMNGISDRGIETIVSSARAITELSMRYCSRVTNAALEMLASERSNRINLLQRLDLCHCKRFSIGLLELLKDSSFCGLRWLGVGWTSLVPGRDNYRVICTKRPWLILCFEGCEVGCRDKWQFRHSNKRSS